MKALLVKDAFSKFSSRYINLRTLFTLYEKTIIRAPLNNMGPEKFLSPISLEIEHSSFKITLEIRIYFNILFSYGIKILLV